ncbi:MAG TPA: hypothetical protein DCM38_00330 [Gammaproteobacteria bacterium]|nr:hypothetical protein [Gammaproteobacteria bacterium]
MIRLGDLVELDKTHSQDAAIVLDMGLLNHNLVSAFTPTQASVNILKRLVRVVLPGVPPEQRAMNWFGSYGSGKSHLGVLIGQLLRDGAHTAEFAGFLRKLENFGENELAEELRRVFLPLTDPDARPYLLVPLYASQTPSLQAKLLEGLYKAIKNQVKVHPALTLEAILPRTEYEAAYHRFEEIVQNAPHYQNAELSDWQLEADYFTTEEMALGLKHYQPLALKTFCLWHQRVCHGAKFRPVDTDGKNVVEAYKEAGQNLATQYHYGGIAVIWDELGHALEDLMRTPERNAVEEIIELQRFVETTCQPNLGHVLFLGLTHVSLAEYGARSEAPQDVRDRLKTIEGRFTSLKVELKPSESEGYHLLGAQRSWTERGHTYLAQSHTAIDSLAAVCGKLPLFQNMSQDLPKIIRDCYPLHVITAAALFAISTRYAQATRTAFTFFRDLNGQTFERSISEAGLFRRELIRLPELIEYYGDKMEKEASGMMEMYRRAIAEVRAKGDECEKKVNIIGVLLLSKVLGEHFQATETFIAAALWDEKLNQSTIETLQKELVWLKEAGLIWKNEVTELWSLAGEAWVDPESLIKEKQDSITLSETWALFTQYPDMRDDLLPLLGKHDIEPSRCGIVRSYSVDLLTSPFKMSSTQLDNPSKAAQVFLVMAKDSEAAIQAQQVCQTVSFHQVYYWIPREGTQRLNDKLRRYVAIEELLKQKTDGEGLKRQFEARWEENRQALTHQMSELFGRQGLVSGRAHIFRAGEDTPLTCKSWHDFRIFLTQAVHQEYPSEIYVCSMGLNNVDDEIYTSHSKVIDVVHKILNFDNNVAYQNDLLGEKETSQTAAIIDGILGQYANQLFIERENGWDIKTVDETKGAMYDILSLIRNELLRKREKPYKISELRKKLLKPPYGLPPSAYAILTAVALRKDIKRLAWVNLKTNEPFEKTLAKAFTANSTLEIRLQDFAKKQLLILSLLAEVLNVSRLQKTDDNDYAREAVQTLRQFIKQLPDTVKEAPKLDDKARQLAKFFRIVGKTPHDLADLLIQLTDIQTEQKSDFGAMNNYPQTQQQLAEIIHAFEKIKNERLHALRQVLREQVPESITEREVLLEQLHNVGTIQAMNLAEVIGTEAINESMIERIVQNVLHKAFDQCSEIEIGQLIGELKALFENSRKPRQPAPIPQPSVQPPLPQQRPASVNLYRIAEPTLDPDTLNVLKELREVIAAYQPRLDKKRMLTAIQQLYAEIERLSL